jgi:hypothetical protein
MRDHRDPNSVPPVTSPETASAPPSAASSKVSRHRIRRTIAAILAVLSGLFVTLGVTSVWLHKTTYQTDEWVSTVGPLARDARVQAALAVWATQQITQAVDTQDIFTNLLPTKAKPLAAPLSTAIDSFISQAALKFFQSDAFINIWTVANRNAHADIVKVLQGKGALTIKNGKVQLDLLPVIDQVLESVNKSTNGRFTNQISSITNLSPDQARAKLSEALGRPLPDDFGTITVFEKQQLSTVQKAAQLFNELVYVLVALAIMLIAAAFAIAPDRRRIAVWVGLSAAGFLVAFRAAARTSGKQVVKQIVVPVNRDAAQAVVSRVLASYLDVTLVALLVGLVVAIIAFLAGPGRYAVAIRNWVGSQGWIRQHAGALQLGLLVVALAWLLLATLTFGKLFLAALIVGALELALWRLREKDPKAVSV